MDDETHRYIDKSVEAASVHNDARFTKASSEVNDVRAEIYVTKTELGAKLDGVKTQVDSSKTELAAKIDGVGAKVDSSKTELIAKVDSSKTELAAKIDGMDAKIDSVISMLKAQNPLTSWQIFCIVIGTLFGGSTLIACILYGFLMLEGGTFYGPGNQLEIAEIVANAIAQYEAGVSRNSSPEIAPENQAPATPDPNSFPSEE